MDGEPLRISTPGSSEAFLGEPSSSSSVQVAVRVRPFLPSEAGSNKCVNVSGTSNSIQIGREGGAAFSFDFAFAPNDTQDHLYNTCISPLLKSCLSGYNATTLAYGQTGSGKTYTMLGPSIKGNASNSGVIPRALRELFRHLQELKKEAADESYDFDVRVQFLELYGEDVRDLLAHGGDSARLVIRDGGPTVEPEVVGATETKVSSAEDALLCLSRGMLRRVTGATAMNSESSRSHAIMSVVIEQTTTIIHNPESTGESDEPPMEVEVKRSKFNFVDLAGSERQKRTNAEGIRLKEGIDINKGLLVLGNVISALGDPKKRGKTFVPYRDSKLTRLLKGSLGGNHKTLMIACVSPSSSNLEESLNCLRYANRAKNIQNNAVVNVDAGSRLVSELREQVKVLASELLRVRNNVSEEISTKEELSGVFTKEQLESLASGADSSGTLHGHSSPIKSIGSNVKNNRIEAETEIERLRISLRLIKRELYAASEELCTTKAEKEYFRLQVPGQSLLGNEDNNDNVEVSSDGTSNPPVFVQKMIEYEREIATLKGSLREAQASSLKSIHIADDSYDKASYRPRPSVIERATEAIEMEQAKLNRLQAVAQGSKMSSDDLNSTCQQQKTTNSSYLDEEEASEQEELRRVTRMYITETDDVSGFDGGVSYEDVNSVDNSDSNESNDELDVQHQHVNAHLLDLSKSIAAKEELVEQLFLSQKKYESMKGFYEEKLNLMESQLSDVENERERMMSELQVMEGNNTSSSQSFTNLKERLKEKEKHIASLRKKQRELLSLTSVSSKNDQVINRLRLDIDSMKHQRVDIQRRISHERKVHAAEVTRLKKDVLHRNRDAAKWKKESEKNRLEAEKANKIAKSRLDQVSKLRNKYKETEKKKRMQTLKRGVLARVGLDSVLVGRKANKNKKRAIDGPVAPTPKRSGSFRKPAPIDMDSLRDFFDEKIADVGRKETTADKLAKEWEDHLDLLGRKEELLSTTLNDEFTEEQKNDELEGINIQIQYKETRIRQLTSRLTPNTPTNSKKDKDIDHKSFIEDPVLTLFPGASTLAAAQAASRVLFGMVVREQRRVTSLARATSALQEKLEEADAQIEAKEAALRAHMEEERHERVSRAQDEQERILSLMSLVQQGETQQLNIEEADAVGVESLVIMLAEERITLLEKQVVELEIENDLNKALKAKEREPSLALGEKEKECDTVGGEVSLLRSTILQIRDEKKKSSERLSKTTTDSLNTQISDSTTESTRDAIDKLVDEAMHYITGDSPRGRESRKIYPKNNILLRGLPPVDISDSEDDEEIPDWADDIMADLALIARGDMPPALLKDGKPPMIHSSPARSTSKSVQQRGPPRNKTSSGGSVFDRLANPGNFTGIQKNRTRQHGNKSMDDRSIDSRDSSSIFGRKKATSDENSVNGMSYSSIFRPGQESMEVNVPRSIDAKISDMNSSFESSIRKDDSMNEKGPSNDEVRSVFERLQSPSNYTGISKQNHESARKAPRSRDTFRYGDTDDEMSMDGQGTVSSNRYVASPNIRRTVSKNPSDTGGHSSGSETPSKSMAEYTQQDVFERLQRTTTKAYTEKHRFDILAANSDHPSNNNTHDPPNKVKPSSSGEPREEPTLVMESSDAIIPQDKNTDNNTHPPSLSRAFPSFEIGQSSESGGSSAN